MSAAVLFYVLAAIAGTVAACSRPGSWFGPIRETLIAAAVAFIALGLLFAGGFHLT